ncbi:MAG TPA: ADOP family duplicated permease [Gemmatimonadaceae bacterium]|nr:ADOP family duplicated permease [Gemmatimonadaceae bacterium]
MWTPSAFPRRRHRAESDFSSEIQAHLALEADQLVAEGWTPADAATEARRRFGNVGGAQERFHDARHIAWIEDAARDVRYALRALFRDKVYLLAAVSALGLGLAANIAVFSLFAAVALKPLPVPAPDRLVTISKSTPTVRFGPFSVADYLFYRANSRLLASIAAAQPSHLRLAGIAGAGSGTRLPATQGNVAEPVIALFVTANYFDTFGAVPVAGRGLRPEDDVGVGSYSALLSDNYWERRFRRDPGIIGSTLLVSGIRATIVGVSPRDFAGVRQEVPDIWVALAALGDIRERALRETAVCCELVGRLTADASVQRAQAELASLAAARRRDLPVSEQQMKVSAAPAISFGRIGELVRPLFAALQAATLMVLLIACANVAGLLLSRATTREREISVRLAIGAGRGRLVRQLITEGVVVAVLAGALAAVVTGYGLATATRLATTFLSRHGGGTLALAITADSRVLMYVAAISVLAGIVFAVAPALQLSRLDLASAFKSSGGSPPGYHRNRLRGFLLAGQIAVSVALLITAVGLARSAASLLQLDPGFRSAGVVSAWLTNPEEIGLPAPRAREIENRVRARLAALPGVQSVSVASRLPLGGNVTTSAMLPAERAVDPVSRDAAPRYPYAYVSEDYFATLGIRLIRGRSFSAQEVREGAGVAVISDSMARTLWPGVEAIGRQLATGTARETGFNTGARAPAGTVEVVGVVRDVHGLAMATVDVGDVYLPRLTNGWSSRILLRVDGDGSAMAREIPRIVHDIEPALPVSVENMSAVVASDAGVVAGKVGAWVLATIGLLGLVLAGVGVYGTVSYSVRHQRREIGIRMALGARPRQVLAATLRGPFRWIAGGVGAGVLLGVTGIKLTNAILVGVSATASALDPAVLVLVPLVIALFALSAAALSGRKAAGLDPAAVLRADT